ncbi:hypothetical protein J1605_006916 [Eschrichtius robustus]|uniref:Uncharacterized protein n=1 Tax=Eschrichtius robustus TaxID=9764 RepID=A0AB34H2T0_ESCRO|nr:hypothetical protein J1605_006916 [Eschrichtius robustus]
MQPLVRRVGLSSLSPCCPRAASPEEGKRAGRAVGASTAPQQPPCRPALEPGQPGPPDLPPPAPEQGDPSSSRAAGGDLILVSCPGVQHMRGRPSRSASPARNPATGAMTVTCQERVCVSFVSGRPRACLPGTSRAVPAPSTGPADTMGWARDSLRCGTLFIAGTLGPPSRLERLLSIRFSAHLKWADPSLLSGPRWVGCQPPVSTPGAYLGQAGAWDGLCRQSQKPPGGHLGVAHLGPQQHRPTSSCWGP